MSNSLKLKFELVTPERVVLREEILQVSVPTANGEITVLPNHIPLVSILKPGVIELKQIDGQVHIIAVSGGLIEVLADKVVLLADTAEQAFELDEERITNAKAKAERLKEEAVRSEKVDFTTVNAMLEKEIARERAIKKWRKIKNIESIN